MPLTTTLARTLAPTLAQTLTDADADADANCAASAVRWHRVGLLGGAAVTAGLVAVAVRLEHGVRLLDGRHRHLLEVGGGEAAGRHAS